ncbi:MAG: FHA domain-containing protein [Bdellovibrionales bacterium]|nr:FHA domain-containing protein [Bdellovibrionales bacterium]
MNPSQKSLPLHSPSLSVARLKIIKGPHKGASYKLVAGKITIGRSSDNDIVLANDDKCSRKQAVVILDSHNNYSIKDLSKRSSIKVNNIVKMESDLQDGDLIQFGSSVLQFEFKNPQKTTHTNNTPAAHHPAAPSPAPVLPLPSPSVNASGNNNVPAISATAPAQGNPLPDLKQNPPSLSEPHLHLTPFPPQGAYPAPPSVNTPYKKRKQKKSLLPKIILVTITIGGIWLFMEDTEQKKEEADKLRTLMDREETVKTLAELKEQEMEKRSKNALSNYKHAQFAYTKGIRDYRKGIYTRAIESFRVCKTLYPQHDLCASYLQKSQVKNQQLIQAWMVAGKDYREKRRFVPCMSSFKNVMMAIKDKHNMTYKEAKENFKICQIQHEDRY